MTITTYTDKEIALKAQLAAMTAERDEYQQAADKMAMEHKVERDTLRQQLAEALIAAKYAEHIDATPENQRETMLYDTLMERNDLRQALAEAQARINSLEETEKQLSDNVIWQAGEIAKHLALIEASRMQEPVAGMYGGTKVSIGAPYPSDIRHGWTPLFTAPVVADDVLKAAQDILRKEAMSNLKQEIRSALHFSIQVLENSKAMGGTA